MGDLLWEQLRRAIGRLAVRGTLARSAPPASAEPPTRGASPTWRPGPPCTPATRGQHHPTLQSTQLCRSTQLCQSIQLWRVPRPAFVAVGFWHGFGSLLASGSCETPHGKLEAPPRDCAAPGQASSTTILDQPLVNEGTHSHAESKGKAERGARCRWGVTMLFWGVADHLLTPWNTKPGNSYLLLYRTVPNMLLPFFRFSTICRDND